MEAEELEELAEEEDLQLGLEAEEQEREEATQAPKVPAALPMRRRKPPQEPIRSHGSGEWYYADPPGRQPLVSRRSGVTPAILLAVLGVLLVSIVVFLVAAGIGSDDELPPVAAASPSAAASFGPTATRAPAATAAPSLEPSPTPKPKIQTWTVRPGQSLSWIAARPRVSVDIKLLQCINRITNPDIIQPGQVLRIPPEGYECPKGWRRSTPEPLQ
jgi:LysM repeat protein